MSLKLPPGRYYGETVRNQEVAGFGLTETIYPPHCKLPRHSHESPYFGLVLRGTYGENYGKRSRVCQPSMLVYHPADEEHSQHFYQAECHLFRIEVCRRRLWQINESASGQDWSVDFRGDILCRLALRLYCEFREPDEVSPIVIEGLALEMMGEALRSLSSAKWVRPPRWLSRAKELIHARCFERLTLRQVAEAVGVHPVYLAREFRRHYRSTVGEYVRQLRIEAACRKIVEPGASLAEVALSCGFHDQSHFTKTFRRVMNVTPAQYRSRFRSN